MQKKQFYLICIRSEQQEVKWNRGYKIDDEPSSEIMDSNFRRLTHNVLVFIDVGCPKVYNDIDDEHDVH